MAKHEQIDREAAPLEDGVLRRLYLPRRHAVTVVFAATYAALAGAYALVVGMGTVAAYALGFVTMVAVQTRLAILLHEGSHHLIHPDKRVNDALTNWLAAYPLGMTLESYRRNHLLHHVNLGTGGDPDFVTLCMPPVESGMLGSMVRSVTGWRHVQLARKYLGALMASSRVRGQNGDLASITARAGLQLLLFLPAALAGQPWAYVAIWVAPLATCGVMINELRSIIEHTPIVDRPRPGESRRLEPIARTVRAGWVGRTWFAPLNFNYHHEHHLYPAVPFSRLPELHAALVDRGYYREPGLVWNGYWPILRTLWSAYGRRRSALDLTNEDGGYVVHVA